ncbi:MAG: hypothetical protein C0399_07265 [Syntrophus sp. (in: bacteria)]|nr:hypothetical protein [Syntrophus sp. (in: bacteria)]
MRPQDLICYEVQHKETDLFCCTKTDISRFIRERVFFYRHQLEEYISMKPLFMETLEPLENDPIAPALVREMIETSALLNVGPMATVAGAVAEFVGKDIMPLSDTFIIENGGDIYLKTDVERVIQIYAKDSPFSEKIGIKLKPCSFPYGVCTSSATVGPSLSFGKADAVCIIATSALFADGLATCLGNIVKKKDDIALAIEKGRQLSGVMGILIVFGEHLGVWGDLDIVKI